MKTFIAAVTVFCLVSVNGENCSEKNARRKSEVQKMVDEHGGTWPLGFELEDCNDDGSFAALQCLYGGCSCYSADGREIVEWTREINDMNCKCARAREDAKGLLGPMFSCDEKTGNYLPRQMKGSMVYCADSEGNKISEYVHVSEAESLQC